MNDPEVPMGSHAALSSNEPSIVVAETEIEEADIRVLPLYTERVNDPTLVGLGPSGEAPLVDIDVGDPLLLDVDIGNDLTLVGLGPPSSRSPVALDLEKNAANRPVSEPPGPWGSHDDRTIAPRARHRDAGIWSAAAPLLLLVAAVVALTVRGLTPSSKGSTAAAQGVEVGARDGTGIFVRVTAPGARVFLDGVDQSTAPVLLMDLEPGSHVVAVTVPGYARFEQPVTLIAGHVSTLEPLLAPASDAPSPPSAERATSEADRASAAEPAHARGLKWPGAGVRTAHPYGQAVKPAPVELEEMTAEQSLAASAPGLLAASSSPPASVVVDGRPIGKSPRAVDIAPGVHEVVFIHPTLGRRSMTVNVTSGKTANAAVDF